MNVFLSELLLLLILAFIFIFTPDTFIGSKYRLSVYLICNKSVSVSALKNTYRSTPSEWGLRFWTTSSKVLHTAPGG